MGVTCRTYGGRRNVYMVLTLKPEERTPLGRPRHRWEHNIKIVLQEVQRLDLAQNRDRLWALVNAEMNLRFP
jgi:hypothetical protein